MQKAPPIGHTGTHLLVILMFSPLLMAFAACASTEGGSPTRIGSESDSSSSDFPTLHPDNTEWVLESLDGLPLIDGTFVSLRLNGDRLGGFDGCNTFGGRHDDGTPVAAAEGTFTMPNGIAGTVIGCVDPKGILDQADTYLRSLRQSKSFRLVDHRLEMVDEAGNARLVFSKQTPLPGTPARLEGTSWRLLSEDDSDNGVRASTLTFLDDQLAEGTTACRDFEASYGISRNSIGFPSMGMTASSSSCSPELRKREGRFTDDLSRANEYSVYQHEGKNRLKIRTSRGRTLAFESVPRRP